MALGMAHPINLPPTEKQGTRGPGCIVCVQRGHRGIYIHEGEDAATDPPLGPIIGGEGERGMDDSGLIEQVEGAS